MNRSAVSNDESNLESIEIPGAPSLPPERKFGLTFAAIGLVVAGVLAYQETGWLVVLCAAALAGLFAGTALLRPASLAGLNKAWFGLGLAIGRIVNPVVMGILFFGVITPVALVTKIFGRDALKRRLDADARSYWVDRDPPGPPGNSFRNQF